MKIITSTDTIISSFRDSQQSKDEAGPVTGKLQYQSKAYLELLHIETLSSLVTKMPIPTKLTPLQVRFNPRSPTRRVEEKLPPCCFLKNTCKPPFSFIVIIKIMFQTTSCCTCPPFNFYPRIHLTGIVTSRTYTMLWSQQCLQWICSQYNNLASYKFLLNIPTRSCVILAASKKL